MAYQSKLSSFLSSRIKLTGLAGDETGEELHILTILGIPSVISARPLRYGEEKSRRESDT